MKRMSSLLKKISLGTANFGNRYGVLAAGNTEVIDRNKSMEIMEAAKLNRILDFDTSENYGDAEKWSFEYSNDYPDISVKTKVTWEGDNQEAFANYEFKIRTLINNYGKERVKTILFHNWTEGNFSITKTEDLKKKLWDKFEINIGCTTYGPKDAVSAYNSNLFRLIQIEYNCLNQSSLNAIISTGINTDIEITVRSVLLQGLLASPNLPEVGKHPYLQSKLGIYYQLCNSWKLPPHEVALRYLNGIVATLQKGVLDQELMNSLISLDSSQHPEIDPRNWNL